MVKKRQSRQPTINKGRVSHKRIFRTRSTKSYCFNSRPMPKYRDISKVQLSRQKYVPIQRMKKSMITRILCCKFILLRTSIMQVDNSCSFMSMAKNQYIFSHKLDTRRNATKTILLPLTMMSGNFDNLSFIAVFRNISQCNNATKKYMTHSFLAKSIP